MHATTGSEMGLVADGLLADLCFLDGRDDEYADTRQDLLSRYGALGVPGPFRTIFGLERCQAEVASVYAEAFSRLGYLPVERTLTPDRWDALAAALPAVLEERDMRRAGAERELGPASLLVDGRIFVDCHADNCREYDVSTGRYEVIGDPEPIVRSARRSTGGFEDGLILTRYGKLQRWGEGWWIDHPASIWTPGTLAIADQLRRICDTDRPGNRPHGPEALEAGGAR
jgi:hypothetical protein